MISRPLIAITMGDPAGVGPEIVVKALQRETVWACCRPLVVGDVDWLTRAADLLAETVIFNVVTQVAQARFDPAVPDVYDQRAVDLSTLQTSTVSARAGRAAAAYVKQAVDLALRGQVAAIATGPIHKAAWRAAGVPHVGHTEMLAELTGASRITTMLVTGDLRVVHVTRHLPLAQVAAQITRERVLETIRLADAGLKEMGVARPRVAVAALNPHGGDEGLIGQEEIQEIGPAVEAAQAEGIDAHGPIPADVVFFQTIRGAFDGVVAMYHDQGHIPIKTHGFERSVTVTLGLPIVRTSVDHGTAFDVAWQGIAHAESLVEAIQLAARLTAGRGS